MCIVCLKSVCNAHSTLLDPTRLYALGFDTSHNLACFAFVMPLLVMPLLVMALLFMALLVMPCFITRPVLDTEMNVFW